MSETEGIDAELEKITTNIETNLQLNDTSSTQDATMDHSFTLGYRSPTSLTLHSANSGGAGNGALSPSQGRSLREYDEKLRVLQKENFNLKLRLFFLEEKSPTGASGNAVNGAVKAPSEDELRFKQNIDLKVENEELRKELQEKQDLLCQAAKAMELMEDNERKTKETHSLQIADYKQKIQYLEDEIRSLEASPANNLQSESACFSLNVTASPSEAELLSKIGELEKVIKDSEVEMKKLMSQALETATKLAERDAVVKSLQERLEDATKMVATDGSENAKSSPTIIETLQAQSLKLKQELADKLCTIQELEEKISSITRAHNKGCETIRFLLIKTTNLDKEVEMLKSKNIKSSPSQASTQSSPTQAQSQSSSPQAPTQSSPTQAAVVNALRAELIQAKNDAEQAVHWRNECVEVCAVLTSRLEELAGFLDSLLKNNDVLSMLAQDRHKAMRKAVDNSLDLSRSINRMSMTSHGRLSMDDRRSSIFQMSCISDVLNDSYFAGRYNGDETDNMKNSSTVERLRAEVEMLRSELDKVNAESKNSTSNASDLMRRSARNLSQHLDLCSESEEWSEPDRKVSHERIGLDDSIKMNAHVRSPCTGKYKASAVGSSSGSDDNNDSRLSRKNSTLRLQEKILDLEAQLSEKNAHLIDLQDAALKHEVEMGEYQSRIDALTNDLHHYQEMNKTLQTTVEQMREQAAETEQDMQGRLSDCHRLDTEQKDMIQALQQELDRVKSDMIELEKDYQSQIDAMVSQQSIKMDTLKLQLNEKFAKELAEQLALQKEQASRELVPRTDLNEQIRLNHEIEKRLADNETLLQLMRDSERELNEQLAKKDKDLRVLHRNIDELTLQTSKTVLERTQFMSERDHFEKMHRDLKEKYDSLATECSELHSRLAKLSHDNAQLHNKMVINETQFQLTRSASQGNARYALTSPKSAVYNNNLSGGDQSGYTSDEVRQRLENSSPDLGIDSDGTGRSSGTDANAGIRTPNRSKVDLNKSFTNILMEGDEDLELMTAPSAAVTPMKSPSKSNMLIVPHDCEKVDKENAELRRKLERTRRAFEKTWAQLRISNQRKEQIEKDIRQEIYKTHSVLKNVRTNIENANNHGSPIVGNALTKSASSSN